MAAFTLANVEQISGRLENLPAKEDISAGSVCRKDGLSAGLPDMTDGNAAGAHGIALQDATSATTSAVIMVNESVLKTTSTLVAGRFYFALPSGQVGEWSDITSGNFVTLVGYATDTSTLVVSIVETKTAKA